MSIAPSPEAGVTLSARRRHVSLSTFRLSVALLCSLTGAIMMAAPKQFDAPVRAVVGSLILPWGFLFLVAGAALMALTPFGARRGMVMAAHCFGGALLVTVGLALIRVGAWPGVGLYLIVGLGTAMIGFAADDPERRGPLNQDDALALTLAVASLAIGLTMLIWPGGFTARGYRYMTAFVAWFGVAFTIGGLALAAAHAGLPLPKWLFWLAHLPAAMAFLAQTVAVPIPNQLWTGISGFGGFTVVIAALPWLGPRLRAVDAASLRTRLAMALAGVAVLPLIAALTIVSQEHADLTSDYGFEFVILVLLLGAVAGIVVANRLAVALTSLARAANSLGGDTAQMPLFTSSITEFADLSRAFTESRERLARRTAEREAAEAHVRQLNVELELLNRYKDEMLDSVSHELRTPLTNILAYSEMLLTKDDPTVREEFLGIINAESERLSRLVGDALDLTKIHSGTFPWHMSEVDVAALVREAAHIHRPLVEARGLRLDVRVDAVPGTHGDRDRLLQVIGNLLNNAIKFTTEGTVGLSCELVQQDIHISVSDTGLGVPSEERERIFEKFHQLHTKLRGKPHGAGLGLAICRRTIEHHAGRIWVAEQLGGGSVFTFTLPVAKAGEQAATSIGAR